MSKNKDESPEERLWIDVWVAVASSDNCGTKAICTSWADAAVSDYKERFGKERYK